MSLIYYQGLNCHLASVVNIADRLGINYLDAFGNLWSETEFYEDSRFNIYLSKRVIPNLELMGIITEAASCITVGEAEEWFNQILNGELFVIGIDAFYIPWSILYHSSHEPHYFFANKSEDNLICYDPTYNIKSKICASSVIGSAFELIRIRGQAAAGTISFVAAQDAAEILVKHPPLLSDLLLDLDRIKQGDIKRVNPLIRQITAMISNRHLFRSFLYQDKFCIEDKHDFFNRDFFIRWEAVKNGLYKISILKDSSAVMKDVRPLLTDLLDAEIEMAQRISTI